MRRLRQLWMAGAAVAATASGHPSAAQQQQATRAPLDRTVLPIAPHDFAGKVGLTATTSVQDWPVPVTAPAGAPNILLIMTDDVGFGASSAFGGPIPTPHLDALARSGARYNNFNTTAMCSPTRAALLTGRNSHAVGSGGITDVATGYPGYNSVIPRSAATVARILRDNGYNTAMFGKHHNIPRWEASLSGPFDHWPTGLGFEYFYGFIIGDTNQWHPRLFRNTISVDNAPDPRLLDQRLADDAIHWVHQQKASSPDKPFFLYYATGTGHGPHQAPAEWIARFKGKFDKGWDRQREDTFARQKREGVIPANAMLTPRPGEIPAWDSLTRQQQRLYARYMEVFAAMIAYQDDQIGRVIDELRRMGQLDNTMVVFIEGDNGSSGEGGLTGTFNEIGHHKNGLSGRRTTQEDIQYLDLMGGPHSYPLYPAPWGWAMDTPFRWMKQMASHLGGVRNGLVVNWPGHVAQAGTVRTQFAHVSDITPTLLEAAHVPAPRMVDGVLQQPMTGRSISYSFAHGTAAEPPRTQYFEMLGSRGLYKDGWFANNIPKRVPWKNVAPDGDAWSSYGWELYDLRKDYSQSRNLAASNPAKVEEMKQAFLEQARANQVLPLDDALTPARLNAARTHYEEKRASYTYWGGDISVAEDMAPHFAGRSFLVTADVELASDWANGPLLARGSWFGGWSFYLKDGVPMVVSALSERPEDQFVARGNTPLRAGPARLEFRFTSYGPQKQAGGHMCLVANGAGQGCADFAHTPSVDAGQGETMDIGKDSGAPVTAEYGEGDNFQGRIKKVTITFPDQSGH